VDRVLPRLYRVLWIISCANHKTGNAWRVTFAVRLLFETGAGFVNPSERGTSNLWRERYRGVIVQSEPGLFESADLLMRETWDDWNALPLVAWVRKRGDELTRFDGDGHDAAVYLHTQAELILRTHTYHPGQGMATELTIVAHRKSLCMSSNYWKSLCPDGGYPC
jgi:hypothetical protein